MTSARALPIRLPPRPGEALDSWLDALAHRFQAATGDLAAALGLATEREPGRGRTAPDWTITTLGSEARAIAAACQIHPDAVRQLTLARYDGIALRLDPAVRKVDRNALWGRTSGSRFCPECLAENSGRWQLSWRLSWSFACLRHQCMLADHCPGCGRAQRVSPHPLTAVPQPGTCARARRHATGQAAPRCGADLTLAPVLKLDPGHPCLTAQRLILETINTGTASFGAYAGQPQPAAVLLTDLRALAGRALASVPPGDLASALPEDLAAEYHQIRSRPHSRAAPSAAAVRPGFLAPAHAAIVAAAVTPALQALALPGARQAGTALRWLFRGTGQPLWRSATLTSTSKWSRGTSPVLQAVQLASFSNQAPRRPGQLPAASPASQIPALLWPAWAIRLAPPRHNHQAPQILASALSQVLLTHSAGLDLSQASALLGSMTPPPDTAILLHRLEHHPRWPAVITALTRLSGHLDAHPSPVDYARRRRLDYHRLLPGQQWAAISHAARIRRGEPSRALTARQWLYERLSGSPADHAPASFAIGQAWARARLAAFATMLTPALLAVLDDYGHAFLRQNGITSEPVTWHPPATLLTGLDLPGPDPSQHDIAELHHLIRRERLRPRAAAARLGTTIDTIRYLLHDSPAPPHDNTQPPTIASHAGKNTARPLAATPGNRRSPKID